MAWTGDSDCHLTGFTHGSLLNVLRQEAALEARSLLLEKVKAGALFGLCRTKVKAEW